MKKSKIHFIGIGGIGISALARLHKARGFEVSGSDLARSEITDALRRESIRVETGPHKKSRITRDVRKVVYTAAVPNENPELKEARRLGIPVQSYAQALGEISMGFKTIAIAGAHGKSTTTALTALALIKGGLDPMVVVGAKLREFGNSNFRMGKSKWLVIEADEYRASFLNYAPHVAVITNIDREHLDFYKTPRNIERAFFQFLCRIHPAGKVVLNGEDSKIRILARRLARVRPDIAVIWHSKHDPAAGKIARALSIPGPHNRSNALAAYRAARACRIPESKILKAFASYRGAWRRFDYQGKFLGAKAFADYAHHPTEIRATIRAAAEKFPKSRIVCVFQPHHYERTRDLFRDFARAFDGAGAVFLLDIYEVAGREKNRRDERISSRALAAAIGRRGVPARYVSEQGMPRALKRELKAGDVLLLMGAGSIWEATKRLIRHSR